MNVYASLPEAMAFHPAVPRLPAAPRKRPKQSRSRMLVASLNEACLRIVRNKGELKVTEIAAVAGVAMGSIYQYFPNMEAIIASVYEEAMLAEIEATRRKAETEWRELSADEVLARLVRATLGFHRRLLDLDRETGRGYYVSFDVEGWFLRVAGGPRAATEVVSKVLARHFPHLNGDALELRALLLTTSLRRSILDAVRRDPAALESPELEQELVAMCRAALSARN